MYCIKCIMHLVMMVLLELFNVLNGYIIGKDCKNMSISCKAMHKVQTAESAPSELCTITLRSAFDTYAFHWTIASRALI